MACVCHEQHYCKVATFNAKALVCGRPMRVMLDQLQDWRVSLHLYADFLYKIWAKILPVLRSRGCVYN